MLSRFCHSPHQVLALSNKRGERQIPFGTARRHLRKGGGSFRALRPLCRLEHLARQVILGAAILCRQVVYRLDKTPEATACLLRFPLDRKSTRLNSSH